jgi:tellurite resistance-related uncharacterized protein
MSKGLPPGLIAYRRTPVFTETTLPAGLRRRHATKPGIWGRIVVMEGQLLFRRLEPFFETTLDSASPAVVAPEEPHEVEPIGEVRFFVEFHAAPKPD